jgi:hypothetical protein
VTVVAGCVVLVVGASARGGADPTVGGSAAAPVRLSPASATVPAAGSTPSTAAPVATPAALSATAPASSSSSGARTRLQQLVSRGSAGSTSVAAYDVTTGAQVRAGATSGMTTASVVKLQLLESLLLKHQRAGTELTDDEVRTVTAMIENSDNGAAETTFWDVGGRDALVDLERPLGLSTTTTVPGSDDYWGLTTTSAAQQLVLLRNLVDADSPIDAAGRAFALGLMRHVEADQTWGVPSVAAEGTSPAVKNGWLSVTDDGDLWAVNSIGIVTVDGHTVLVAVMTQHDDSLDDGIDRVETLAAAAVAALR